MYDTPRRQVSSTEDSKEARIARVTATTKSRRLCVYNVAYICASCRLTCGVLCAHGSPLVLLGRSLYDPRKYAWWSDEVKDLGRPHYVFGSRSCRGRLATNCIGDTCLPSTSWYPWLPMACRLRPPLQTPSHSNQSSNRSWTDGRRFVRWERFCGISGKPSTILPMHHITRAYPFTYEAGRVRGRTTSVLVASAVLRAHQARSGSAVERHGFSREPQIIYYMTLISTKMQARWNTLLAKLDHA